MCCVNESCDASVFSAGVVQQRYNRGSVVSDHVLEESANRYKDDLSSRRCCRTTFIISIGVREN